MKLDDVKHIIDNYFEKVTPEEVVKTFEDMGCEFDSISDKYEFPVNLGNTQLEIDENEFLNNNYLEDFYFTTDEDFSKKYISSFENINKTKSSKYLFDFIYKSFKNNVVKEPVENKSFNETGESSYQLAA